MLPANTWEMLQQAIYDFVALEKKTPKVTRYLTSSLAIELVEMIS